MFWYLVLEKNVDFWYFVEFFILVPHILRFQALDPPLQNDRRPRTPILNPTIFVKFR